MGVCGTTGPTAGPSSQASETVHYDCSYIRIVGGGVVAPAYTPTFRPGKGTRFPNRCVSSVNRLGKCAVEPCTRGGNPQGRSLYTGGEMVPAQFAGGAKPPPIRATWFPVGSPVGGGVLGVNAVFVTDVRGRRRFRLKRGVLNVVTLNSGLPRFTIQATLWGNVRVDGVAFRTDGRTVSVEREAPWYLTRPDASGKGFLPWGGWTTGKEIKVKVTPLAIRGQKVKIQSKTFLVKVVM
eukprot:contig_17187_g4184